MELKFDKEIDALLRRVASSERPALSDGNSSPHLDADEISAFAENALPDKARSRCAVHLADCDQCRLNFSNLISLNSETYASSSADSDSSAASLPVVPWYRGLLATPNLAFAMGAVLLLLAGITAVTILQYRSGYETAQVRKSENGIHKTSENDSILESNAYTPAANLLLDPNTALNNGLSLENSAVHSDHAGKNMRGPGVEQESERYNELRRDDDSGLKEPRLEELPAPGRKSEVAVIGKEENAPVADIAVSETAQAAKPAPMTPEEKAKSASKKNDKLTVRAADERDKDGEAGAREISGKTFNRANGVWYDSTYANQPTVNVRRKSAEYRNLDQGLRSIAEKLDGTVVVVWKQKAYRIQ